MKLYFLATNRKIDRIDFDVFDIGQQGLLELAVIDCASFDDIPDVFDSTVKDILLRAYNSREYENFRANYSPEKWTFTISLSPPDFTKGKYP